MGVNWTEEQMEVITQRDKNLLVSAAAGSGKTAVLVERIIGRILDQKRPVDIDRMLIVTFTSAAAAEMRERIGAALEAALKQDPENSHLMKQATLLHHAQITTIHSFCLYLIRSYFHRVDLEPNFRIAEQGELNLLQEDVMDEVLTANYEEASEAFLRFVECFASGKRDDGLKDLVLKLYHFAMSFPWPKEWLRGAAGNYRFDSIEELEEKEWMKRLVVYLRQVCTDLTALAEDNVRLSLDADGPLYLNETAERDRMRLFPLAGAEDYRSLADALSACTFDRLPSKRNYEGDETKRERFKALREEIKDTVKRLKADFAGAGEEELLSRMSEMAGVAEELARLAEEFMDAYDAKKRKENILDFDDLEHFALKILLDEETKQPTEIAMQCRKRYEEVMVDEYQDSNLVQESLLLAVSGEELGRFNRFMVGDVKQSIYRFRLARPDLFMEKYDAYTEESDTHRKIELHKNFRSRREVIDTANCIFSQIMKKDLGNVAYDEAAALYPGAAYPDCDGMESELLLADPEDELLEEAGLSDPARLEAELVAAKIRTMLRAQRVTDAKTGELRAARYGDIVILLRSFGAYADTFLEVLGQKGIPAHAASKTGYFQAQEVAAVLCMLRILDNPRQDIPLAAVLRSAIGNFSDEELAVIKAAGRGKPFHCCVLEAVEKMLPAELFVKLQTFITGLDGFRRLAEELSIYELLQRVLKDTGYLAYVTAMPGGERRRANLEMLLEKASAYEKSSYRGLFHFIRYIDKLQKYEVDYGEADVGSANADAVRIMTIHKSKGLEFPIVFVCGTARQFNRMDTKSRMVIHPELGIGMDYIDPVRRIRGATLCKKAVAKQIELEDQGEELRVLYVALTRAKEKLVMTGVTKELSLRLTQRNRLSFRMRAAAKCYLDWILPAMLASGDGDRIQVWGAKELVEEEAQSQLADAEGLGELLYRASRPDEEADAYVKAQLSYRYPQEAETNRRTKYAVSELKGRLQEAVFEEDELPVTDNEPEEPASYVPRFAGGEGEANRGAFYGTAMHRAVACLPVALLAGNPKLGILLDTQLARLTKEGRLTEEMRDLLGKKKLFAFYRSNLAVRMKAASERGALYLEQPFVMGRPADEVEGDGSQTMVLIQGIIDAFFIEDKEIVLVDYKTDRIQSEEELVMRYESQLNWYKRALESNLGMHVRERILYSFYLDKAIVMEDEE